MRRCRASVLLVVALGVTAAVTAPSASEVGATTVSAAWGAGARASR